MRAVRCHALTGPSGLRVDEEPEPEPGPGEVLVDVRAAGVNFPDVLLSYGRYQIKPEPPFVPGGEAAGVVKAVGWGADVDEDLARARLGLGLLVDAEARGPGQRMATNGSHPATLSRPRRRGRRAFSMRERPTRVATSHSVRSPTGTRIASDRPAL